MFYLLPDGYTHVQGHSHECSCCIISIERTALNLVVASGKNSDICIPKSWYPQIHSNPWLLPYEIIVALRCFGVCFWLVEAGYPLLLERTIVDHDSPARRLWKTQGRIVSLWAYTSIIHVRRLTTVASSMVDHGQHSFTLVSNLATSSIRGSHPVEPMRCDHIKGWPLYSMIHQDINQDPL